MDILAAIKREERKLEKQLGKMQHQLGGIRAATKSAAGRAAIGRATKSLHRVGRVGADDSNAMVEEGRVDAGYVDLGHVAGYAILGRYGARSAGVIAR